MRAKSTAPFTVIPTILTVAVELGLLLAYGSSPVLWQECVISLILLGGVIVCATRATTDRAIFGLPLGLTSSIALTFQLIANVAIVIIGPTEQLGLVGLLIGLILIALTAIMATSLSLSDTHTRHVENEIKTKTAAIKEARVRLNTLLAKAPTNQKALIQKVADAARYASPISNERTERIDEELAAAIGQLEQLVIDKGDEESVRERCKAIVSLIAEHDILAHG